MDVRSSILSYALSLNTFFRLLARVLTRLLLRLTVRGLEHVPRSGGVLLTMNHLGGADPVLVVGHFPRPLKVVGKAEILGWPIINLLVRTYGMIPVQRGEPDRATLGRLLGVLAAGQALLIAPEGRESGTGQLEAGKGGPAFLAQHAQVPVLPVAITGTAWKQVLPAWRRGRRPCVTLTFGPVYGLPPSLKRREAVDEMMRRLAALLPPEYRGVYAND
jgi:1-acyl-sn-glycerol-3-phosphate acyltransferase